jgi:hypothetical protein
MSRFWQQPRRVAFNEDFHTRFNKSSNLNQQDLTLILRRALQNDPSDAVLRRMLTNVCGLDLSHTTATQLSALKTIMLFGNEKPSTTLAEYPLIPTPIRHRGEPTTPHPLLFEDDGKNTHAFQKTVQAVRQWATEQGIEWVPNEHAPAYHSLVNLGEGPIDDGSAFDSDGEGTDGFTHYERQAANSNRTIGENEEPDVSDDEVKSDIDDEGDDDE